MSNEASEGPGKVTGWWPTHKPKTLVFSLIHILEDAGSYSNVATLIRGKPSRNAQEGTEVVQSCLTLCNPMDCTVLGILPARIPEWVAFPFSRDGTQLSHSKRELVIVTQTLAQLALSWPHSMCPKWENLCLFSV